MLSQLDFGLFEQWQETLERSSGKEGSVALTLWGAASVGGGGKRSSTEGSSVVFEQTVESYASRLLRRLEEEEQLVRLEEAATDKDLRRGTVVAAEGSFEQLDYSFSTPPDLFGRDWKPLSDAALYKLHGDGDARVPVGAILGQRFAVVAPWTVENLRVPLEEFQEELQGETAEIVGTVRRVFRREGGEPGLMVFVRPIALF
jgi:hypothetical protein